MALSRGSLKAASPAGAPASDRHRNMDGDMAAATPFRIERAHIGPGAARQVLSGYFKQKRFGLMANIIEPKQTIEQTIANSMGEARATSDGKAIAATSLATDAHSFTALRHEERPSAASSSS